MVHEGVALVFGDAGLEIFFLSGDLRGRRCELSATVHKAFS